MGQIKLNGFHLKLIAVISMFIDHFAATVMERMMAQPMSFWADWDMAAFNEVYHICRMIGRIAFPLYCFMIVEGLRYTKNRKKYALRLGLFFLISEIPFDLAFNHKVVEIDYNNVFGTLLIGLLVIWAIDALLEKYPIADLELPAHLRTRAILLEIVIIFAGLVIAELLTLDYGGAGVITIAIIYIMYRDDRLLLGFVAAVVILGILTDQSEWVAILGIIPLYLYDGTRGRQMKYFFYGFYPGHLLLLDLLVVALGMSLF